MKIKTEFIPKNVVWNVKSHDPTVRIFHLNVSFMMHLSSLPSSENDTLTVLNLQEHSVAVEQQEKEMKAICPLLLNSWSESESISSSW